MVHANHSPAKQDTIRRREVGTAHPLANGAIAHQWRCVVEGEQLPRARGRYERGGIAAALPLGQLF